MQLFSRVEGPNAEPSRASVGTFRGSLAVAAAATTLASFRWIVGALGLGFEFVVGVGVGIGFNVKVQVRG